MLTLLINESKPLAGLFANATTGGIGSVPDISVADDGQAVSVQTFTRTAGVITDSFTAGDVLHIGIGDGVNAPVCYIELSSASPATGTMAINTDGMVALFAATSANQLTLNVGVVRTRGAYTNTIFSAPIVIHRSVIDPDTAVPTPSILGTGVAAALQVAINTALGFVRLDSSARLPAVDGSQLTNVPNELPSQTGNSGKYLTTNGTATSWGTVSTGLTVGTTAIASGTTGRILYDNAGVLGELPVGTGVATALAVNVGSAGAFLTSAVTSITGAANEITVTGTTTPTLSLPSALTFTGKTITGGTFTGGAFNGTVGATTPDTVAGTTGTFSGEIVTNGASSIIHTNGASANIYTNGASAAIFANGTNGYIATLGANGYIATFGSGGYIESRSTFRLNDGTFKTTLSHAPTADRAIALPDAGGTLLLSNGSGANLTGTAASLTAGNATLAATVTVANEATDTTCFPLFATAATGSLSAMSNATLTYNCTDQIIGSTRFAIPRAASSVAAVKRFMLTTGNADNNPAVTIQSDDGAFGSQYLILRAGSANSGYQTGYNIELDVTGARGVSCGGSLMLGTPGTVGGSLKINGSTSDSATLSVSATGGLLALPSGTTATNMTLTTPDLGTPSVIVLTNASGTASININGTVGATTPAAGSFTTLTASSTTSLLLGTAGSAVGNVGFRNATSGTTTLAPATGALGTGTVTLPLSGTLATLEGSNTYTGTTNTFTLPTTTGTTTTSGIAVAANSLTTGTGIYAASSTLTSGKLLDLQVTGTAAAASQTVLNIATAGANGTSGITSKGAVISNTHTGTTSTNTALELTASGGTTNTALLITAGSIVAQTSSTKYTTITPGAVGGLAFTLTTDGSNTNPNYGMQLVGGCLTITGGNGFGQGLVATGLTIAGGLIQCTSLGWVTDGNVGFTFTSATITTGSSVTKFNAAATTESTSTTTGSIVTAGGIGVVKNANIGGTLAVNGATTLTGLLTANGGVTLGDAQNIAFNTTTGTKIGATTSQKLSFWSATPIVQPTTAVANATVASPGGGSVIKTDDTFDGYTLAQVVKALRNAGLLA